MYGQFILGKMQEIMMFAIEYEPRVEDPVVVATFQTLCEAEAYMEIINDKRP